MKKDNKKRAELRIKVRAMSKLDKKRLARETTDPDVLAILAEDEDKEVRTAVAANSNTDGHTLEKLRANDSSVAVQVTALRTVRNKFVSTIYQQREFERKLAYTIYEDEKIVQRVRRETLQLLYEKSQRLNKKDYDDLNKRLTPFYDQKPELSEYMKALEEGIILGSMLEGAHEHSVDLMVANLTGRDIDKANIDGNTKEEIEKQSEHNARETADFERAL